MFSDLKMCEWEIEKEAERIMLDMMNTTGMWDWSIRQQMLKKFLKEFAEKIRGECQCGSPHSSSATSS